MYLYQRGSRQSLGHVSERYEVQSLLDLSQAIIGLRASETLRTGCISGQSKSIIKRASSHHLQAPGRHARRAEQPGRCLSLNSISAGQHLSSCVARQRLFGRLP
jgi:hypothetical protein